MLNFSVDECWYKAVCSMSNTNECNHCIRFTEMKYLMESSNLPKSKCKPQILTPAACDYDAYCKLADIKDNIENFVSSGNSLYITSDTTGNGKTSWAIKLMLKYFDSIWAGNGFNIRGVFVHVPTFLLKCKDFDNRDTEFEQLKKSLLTADLVIWDDIASTDISAYDYSQLLMYLDGRVLNGLSNIYTGNITSLDRLSKKLGTKLASRLWSSNTEVIEFKGGDRR